MITEAARICVIETIDDGEMTATTADAHNDNQKQQAGCAGRVMVHRTSQALVGFSRPGRILCTSVGPGRTGYYTRPLIHESMN